MEQNAADNRYSVSVVINSDTMKGKEVWKEILAKASAQGYTETELHAIQLAVEEALVNAIKHGNGSDPTRKVRVDYTVDEEEVRVRIEDEGPGFDFVNVPDPTAPENLGRPCGRGVLFMRYYMQAVFRGRGNIVEMVKRRGERGGGGEEGEKEGQQSGEGVRALPAAQSSSGDFVARLAS